MSPCTRAWEVEAGRDGRLSGYEQTSLQRHVSLCAECAREQARLEELARSLRALPVRGSDELTIRRQRQVLLARAHEDRQPVRFARRPWWRTAGLVAALACGLLVLGIWPLYVRRPATARVAVRPDADAEFTRWSGDGGDVVELKRGRLTFDVERFNSAYGVLVRTPDGEIEDIGTVFSVTVRDGRTEAISVAAGRVVARIAGRAALDISAGETLRPYEDKEHVEASDARPSTNTNTMRNRRPRASRTAREPADQAGAPPNDVPNTTSPMQEPILHTNPPTATVNAEAARQFALAVARVEAHDDEVALRLLEHFAVQFSDDPRAEDAAYLRVVVLARGTNRGALKIAARAYLDIYPGGFRAPEVSRLITRDAGL